MSNKVRRITARNRDLSRGVETLERRELLATITSAESYRPLNFKISDGSFSGTSTIPHYYSVDGGKTFLPYNDSYYGSDKSVSGKVIFNSPTHGSGAATMKNGTGGGTDTFKHYTYNDEGTGTATVDNGSLGYVAGKGSITYTSGYVGSNSGGGVNPWMHNFSGTFDPLTWKVNVNWKFPLPNGQNPGTSTGSYTGTVKDAINTAKTDYAFSAAGWLNSAADAIHDDKHSIDQVANKVGAQFEMTTTGQFVKTKAMSDTVADVRLFWSADPTVKGLISEVGNPVPIHWNTDQVKVTVADIFKTGSPPSGAKYLIATADYTQSQPAGKVAEADENNNVVALKIGYDAMAKELGWNDGGVAGVPDNNKFQIDFKYGFSDVGLPPGSHSYMAELYWSNGKNANLGWLIQKTSGGGEIPNTTDGNFLKMSPDFSTRPAGATKLRGEVTIDVGSDVNLVNNAIDLPLTELTLRSFKWLDPAIGKVELKYGLQYAALPFNTKINLAWTDVAGTSGHVIKSAGTITLPQGKAARNNGDYTAIATVGNIATRPAGSHFLRAWIDQPTSGLSQGTILEPNESNSSLSLLANVAPHIAVKGLTDYTRSNPVAIVTDATVTDVDSPDFGTGNLMVSVSTGASITNTLAIGSGFTVDGSGNVRRQGANMPIIGTLNDDGGKGKTALIVTFKPAATKAIVEQLMESITFKTTGAVGKRAITFSVTDDRGASSNKATVTLTVK